MAYGFVYVMRNRCMPNIYKIGYTDRTPLTRRDELSASTSIPCEFEIVCYGEIENARQLESDLHSDFSDCRVSGNREFFKLSTLLLRDLARTIKEESAAFALGDGSFIYEAEEKDEINERISHFLDQNADPIYWPEFDNEAPF